MSLLTCHECSSGTIEWVGHRNLVRCQCGNVWEPRDAFMYKNIIESVPYERESLPEKGDPFKPHLLTRLNSKI